MPYELSHLLSFFHVAENGLVGRLEMPDGWVYVYDVGQADRRSIGWMALCPSEGWAGHDMILLVCTFVVIHFEGRFHSLEDSPASKG